MSVPTVIAVVGGIALLIGIFGGGVKAKEIEIPSINGRIRVFSTITGMVLLAIASLLTSPELFIPAHKNPTEVQPTQNITSPPRKLTSSDYGTLLYEDNFDNDTAIWSLQKGSRIQNGILALSPGESTNNPSWNSKYSDYIFETSFQFADIISVDSSGMSAYVRFDPSSIKNCRVQVGVSTKGGVQAWNYDGTNVKQILPLTFAPEFNSNGANKLTVIINGEEFQIFLNNVFVRSFEDSTCKLSSIALDVDGTSISFDYVRIYAVP